jgi:hypothetical protein
LKSPPIINSAAPTTKPGDIPLTDSMVWDYRTDANEQSWPARWGRKRNTMQMNCLKKILLYFCKYCTRKTHNDIFLVLLINILCFNVIFTATYCVMVLSVIDDDRSIMGTCWESKGKILLVKSCGRFRLPRALRRRSAAGCLLGLRVRIPPGAWMFVLSGRCRCDGTNLRVCYWAWSSATVTLYSYIE